MHNFWNFWNTLNCLSDGDKNNCFTNETLLFYFILFNRYDFANVDISKSKCARVVSNILNCIYEEL